MANFLVIAASSSIGQAVVHLLNEAGHTIFKTARDNSKITPDAYLYATDFDAVEEIFQKAGDLWMASLIVAAPFFENHPT